MLNHDCSHLFMLGLNSLRSIYTVYLQFFSFYVFFQYISTYVKDMEFLAGTIALQVISIPTVLSIAAVLQ